MAEGRDEAGAASVVVLALAFGLVLVAWGSGSVVGLVVAHRTAQNAADLAALAAAQRLSRGTDGCRTAADVAVANHAQLLTCAVTGAVVLVDVEVEAGFGTRITVHARARAGPSSVAEDVL